MSGISAGGHVGEAASTPEEGLDEAGRKTVESADYTLSLVALAIPDQRDKLMVLTAQVRLLAGRERAARYEARMMKNEATRYRVSAQTLENTVTRLEDEVDKLKRQLLRARAKLAVSMNPALKKAKK